MSFSPLIRQMIEALRGLPGVGPKTAQRMALHLLERDRAAAAHLSKALDQAIAGVGYCRRCRTLSETELCEICTDERRDASLLCVLQSPADVWAVEQAGGFNGRYFVLKGHLSPIDGMGPDEIGVPALVDCLEGSEVTEVILATNDHHGSHPVWIRRHDFWSLLDGLADQHSFDVRNDGHDGDRD